MHSPDFDTRKELHLLCNLIESACKLADEEQNWTICEWAEHELLGYGEHDPLPEYRQIPCDNVGYFVDVYDGSPHTETISMDTLTEADRAELSYWRLTAPLEQLLKAKSTKHPRQWWPTPLLHKYAAELLPGYYCKKAFRKPHSAMDAWLVEGVKQQLHAYLQEHQGQRRIQEHHDQPVELEQLLKMLLARHR